MAVNSILLGRQGHRDLATLAHQIGHIFDRNRYKSLGNIPTEKQKLLRQLRATAFGLRGLKLAGYSPKQIAQARKALKTAYKTYKYTSQGILQQAKNAYQQVLARTPRNTFKPPKFGSNLDEWPKLKRIRAAWQDASDWGRQAQADRIADRYKRWRTAIRDAVYSRRERARQLMEQRADYNYQRLIRGLPELK